MMTKDFIIQHISKYRDYLIDLSVEECAEYISILQRSKRFDRQTSNNDICSEIADIIIMMEFMKHIYGVDLVESEIDKKVQRIKDRYYNDTQ